MTRKAKQTEMALPEPEPVIDELAARRSEDDRQRYLAGIFALAEAPTDVDELRRWALRLTVQRASCVWRALFPVVTERLADNFTHASHKAWCGWVDNPADMRQQVAEVLGHELGAGVVDKARSARAALESLTRKFCADLGLPLLDDDGNALPPGAA